MVPTVSDILFRILCLNMYVITNLTNHTKKVDKKVKHPNIILVLPTHIILLSSLVIYFSVYVIQEVSLLHCHCH